MEWTEGERGCEKGGKAGIVVAHLYASVQMKPQRIKKLHGACYKHSKGYQNSKSRHHQDAMHLQQCTESMHGIRLLGRETEIAINPKLQADAANTTLEADVYILGVFGLGV